VRDRALLLLLASGLRHATLIGLDAEHLHYIATAVALTLDRADAFRGPLVALEGMRAPPPPRSPQPQPTGSVVLRSGVRTVPVPAQTGQATRLPPTTSTTSWPACR
jgi:hypothetical protein